MTVSTSAYLKGFYDSTVAIGAKVIASDFALEIEGFEGNWLLAKQCPWPTVTPAGEIEIPTALGAKQWQSQQLDVAQQGQVSLQETVAGSIDNMLIGIIMNGGYFNAKIYEGTPVKYLRYKRIVDCFIRCDPLDRDWENRSQPLMFNGTMFYHYFGEIEEGNSTNYR